MSKISKVKVGKDLKASVKKAVDKIGGFKRFLQKEDVVLLKPNFNTADPFPASSDPKFLKAVIELVYEIGVKKVILGESCTFRLNTRKVMEELNIFDFSKDHSDLDIVSFNERRWIKKEIPNGRYLESVSLSEILDQVDKLILLPCLKTHCVAQFTGSLKLSVGFTKPVERLKMHLEHLQEKIAELNKMIDPNLVIMDARKCFIKGGPSEGDVRKPNLILASCERIPLDSEGVSIIQSFKGNSLGGIVPKDLAQIKYAREIGIN